MVVDGLLVCPLQRFIIITALVWQEVGSGDERLNCMFGHMVQCGGFCEVALKALY